MCAAFLLCIAAAALTIAFCLSGSPTHAFWLTAALAILMLEVAAFWGRSSIASLILGTIYLVLAVPPLWALSHSLGFPSPESLIAMTVHGLPVAACSTAAIAHLLWFHRLRAWNRSIPLIRNMH